MAVRSFRLLPLALTAAVLAAAVAAARRPPDQPAHAFRVTFGCKDDEPTDWNAKVAVEGGEVTSLAGWRFEDKDAVEGTAGWKCRTRNYIAPGQRYPVQKVEGKVEPPREQPWPNGVTLAVKGAAPTVTLSFAEAEVSFKAADVGIGAPAVFMGGNLRVERLPDTRLVRPAAPMPVEGAVQDDHPAFWVRYKTGKQSLAWVSYHKAKTRVLLAERDGPDGAWSEPTEVAGPGDHFRTALASTHGDTLWVVWASQRNGDWQLYARPYAGGKLGDEVRVSDGPGPHLWHRMTTDGRGRAWLVWQRLEGYGSHVYARCVDGDGWHDPVKVSDAVTSNWDPQVAADAKEDRVWVAWDSYDTGSYNVRVRSLSGGPKPTLGEVQAPEPSPRFQAHATAASDRDGRLWVAWDESGSQWGKDTGFLYQNSPATRLYASRRVRVKCLADGRWREPAQELEAVLPPELREYVELPQLQDDGQGRVWLAFRHRTCRRPRADGWAAQGRWDAYATAYLGDRWTPPVELPQSGGRNDMRASSQRDPQGNVYFAFAADNRPWALPAMPPRNLHVAVSRFGGAPAAQAVKLVDRPATVAEVAPIHPKEREQVERIRGYRVEAGGKSYRILRGDLHRHTDISNDGPGDGSIMDLHRYARDAASLDFAMIADHNMGGDNEYNWWRTQQANDLYTVPRHFISVYGYERSVPYPNGHRNVLWPERGHRTLPLPRPGIPASMAADTGRLYAELRRTNGICTLHTSATQQGTNWKEPTDPEVEPVVELFQGYHTSYEALGAPKAEGPNTDVVHGGYREDGFVDKALAGGHKLGFQSSSDHISTHVSFACALAEQFTRQGIIDAFRKRHSYAATDNIVLDVRMGDAIMGDEVRTGPAELRVVALGTGPIARVDFLRDGAVAHAYRPTPGATGVRTSWQDPNPPTPGGKGAYYYVRVEQRDGNLAWSSPIWVK
jgi:hypothetical protein